ncbi:hypothetical protein FF1_015565 [Malus domestica]
MGINQKRFFWLIPRQVTSDDGVPGVGIETLDSVGDRAGGGVCGGEGNGNKRCNKFACYRRLADEACGDDACMDLMEMVFVFAFLQE